MMNGSLSARRKALVAVSTASIRPAWHALQDCEGGGKWGDLFLMTNNFDWGTHCILYAHWLQLHSWRQSNASARPWWHGCNRVANFGLTWHVRQASSEVGKQHARRLSSQEVAIGAPIAVLP